MFVGVVVVVVGFVVVVSVFVVVVIGFVVVGNVFVVVVVVVIFVVFVDVGSGGFEVLLRICFAFVYLLVFSFLLAL